MAAESIVSERSYTKLCVVAFEEVRIQMVKRRTFAFERRQGIVKLGIFLCLFAGVVAFGFSVVKEANQAPSPGPMPPTATPMVSSSPTFKALTSSQIQEQISGLAQDTAISAIAKPFIINPDGSVLAEDTYLIKHFHQYSPILN
jgi:hypothetical protein